MTIEHDAKRLRAFRRVLITGQEKLFDEAMDKIGDPLLMAEDSELERETVFNALMDEVIARTNFEPGPASLLMSRVNPEGFKLEDLLTRMGTELILKNEHLKANPIGSAVDTIRARVIGNNQKIITMLQECLSLQIQSLNALDRIGPDQGPTKPRI